MDLQGKEITFKYKDSLIVKPKNKHEIRPLKLDEIQKELATIFTAVTMAAERRSETRKASRIGPLLKYLLPAYDVQVRSEDILNCLQILVKEDTTGGDRGSCADRVNHQICANRVNCGTHRVLIEVKTEEQGLYRNHTDVNRKMIFCKSVRTFYKNWKKGMYK